jgi:hypothetical protein
VVICQVRGAHANPLHSWNQRYQNETSELLDELTGRLRELEVMAGTRRPSVWQTNSSGSVGSNNSSLCTNLRQVFKASGICRQQPTMWLQAHLALSTLRHNINHRTRMRTSGVAQPCNKATQGGHRAHSLLHPNSSTTTLLLRLCSNRSST